MPPPRPDARARRILEAVAQGGAAPEETVESVFHELIVSGGPTGTDVAVAYDLYLAPEHHVLDALLMAKADDKAVAEALGLTDAALAVYRHLFFDRTVFPHAFAVRRYAKELPNDATEEYKSYEQALTEGPEALLNQYRIGDIPLADSLDVARRVMTELHSRVREHRNRPLTTRTAQEALKAGKVAVDVASTLHTIAPRKSTNAVEALEVELRAKEMTVSAEVAEVNPVDLIRSGPGPGVDPG